MTLEEKSAEEAKRERMFDPVKRWRAILAAIEFAEANMAPEFRRNRPRWHPWSVESPFVEGLRKMTPEPKGDVYSLADLQNWPAATDGLFPAPRLAVLGDPIAHSVSPPMQNAALTACGLDVRYTRLHIRADELATALGLLHSAGFIGVNLTIPHKVAALTCLGAVDPLAARLGAVNTVRVEAGGRLLGFNTDGPGFVRAVQEAFCVDLADLRVLVLGAGGGAGRALAAQCFLQGCPRLLLANRTSERVVELAAQLGDPGRVEMVAWDPTALAQAASGVDLIVNATSLGLGRGGDLPLPPDALRPGLLVFDAVYRAGAVTPLVEAARQVGAEAVDGFALLLHQGALAFERWFDQPAPLEVMRAALRIVQ